MAPQSPSSILATLSCWGVLVTHSMSSPTRPQGAAPIASRASASRLPRTHRVWQAPRRHSGRTLMRRVSRSACAPVLRLISGVDAAPVLEVRAGSGQARRPDLKRRTMGRLLGRLRRSGRERLPGMRPRSCSGRDDVHGLPRHSVPGSRGFQNRAGDSRLAISRSRLSCEAAYSQSVRIGPERWCAGRHALSPTAISNGVRAVERLATSAVPRPCWQR